MSAASHGPGAEAAAAAPAPRAEAEPEVKVQATPEANSVRPNYDDAQAYFPWNPHRVLSQLLGRRRSAPAGLIAGVSDEQQVSHDNAKRVFEQHIAARSKYVIAPSLAPLSPIQACFI